MKRIRNKVHYIRNARGESVYAGREVSFVTKIGLAGLKYNLELMQIVKGEHIVKEFLDKHGRGSITSEYMSTI